MPDPKSKVKKLLSFKKKPKSPAVGSRGEGAGRSAARKRTAGTPSVKDKRAAMSSGYVSYGKPTKMVPAPAKKICDENHPDWNPATQNCDPVPPPWKEKGKVAVKMRTIRYDDPVREEEEWEEEHSGLTPEERVKKTEEYRKRKRY
jgi:hypothetical protein